MKRVTILFLLALCIGLVTADIYSDDSIYGTPREITTTTTSTTGGAGGNPFDQELNTTEEPTFEGLSLVDITENTPIDLNFNFSNGNNVIARYTSDGSFGFLGAKAYAFYNNTLIQGDMNATGVVCDGSGNCLNSVTSDRMFTNGTNADDVAYLNRLDMNATGEGLTNIVLRNEDDGVSEGVGQWFYTDFGFLGGLFGFSSGYNTAYFRDKIGFLTYGDGMFFANSNSTSDIGFLVGGFTESEERLVINTTATSVKGNLEVDNNITASGDYHKLGNLIICNNGTEGHSVIGTNYTKAVEDGLCI